MRSFWITWLVLACVGCSARVAGIRPQVTLQARGRVHAQAGVQTGVQSGIQVEVQPEIQTGVQVEVQPEIQAGVQVEVQPDVQAEIQTVVPMDGSVVVEFFGIPLGAAQDVVFVLDRSGSMANFAQGRAAAILRSDPQSSPPSKLDVAHAELVDALERLPEGTRMNVIFFDDALEAFAPHSVPLEASARDGMIAFVRATAPNGNTALAPAMRTAFLMNPRRVVLLSDGLGNVGGDSNDVLRDAREAMIGGVRLDTIGLGANQDTALLRSLATESGGVYQDLR